MSQCPICDANVAFASSVEVGEIMACGDCGSELEVESLSPMRVRKAPAVQEDWGE